MSVIRRCASFLLSILILTSSLALSQVPVSADGELVITVDSLEDLPDFVTNSVCSAFQATGGPCTLRAAISEANGNIQNQPVTILVPPGLYTLDIVPILPDDTHTGDLDITATTSTNQITIQSTEAGRQAYISTTSSFNDRILQVGWGANVLIRDVKFTGAHLVLTGNGSGGGAILNEGSLTLERTDFMANSVTCAQGANCSSYVIGGSILNNGSLYVSDSTFFSNSAERGFAIFNSGGAPNCQIHHSLFMQNSGGVGTITNYSAMTIVNSTISDNISTNSWLAGVVNDGVGQLRMQSCTLANQGNNSSLYNSGTAFLSDNIFVAPIGLDNFYQAGGALNSGGYNIFNDGSYPGALGSGDLLNTDPMLGSLGDYGGPTWTHSLPVNSPAVNHRPGNCETALYIIEDDQRHQARSDGRCDTGSYELGSTYLPFITR
jgi:CSLREA domain-containing protein